MYAHAPLSFHLILISTSVRVQDDLESSDFKSHQCFSFDNLKKITCVWLTLPYIVLTIFHEDICPPSLPFGSSASRRTQRVPPSIAESLSMTSKVIRWDEANQARPPLPVDLEGPGPLDYAQDSKPLRETNAPAYSFGRKCWPEKSKFLALHLSRGVATNSLMGNVLNFKFFI